MGTGRFANRGITQGVRDLYFDKSRTPRRRAELKKLYRDIFSMIEYLDKTSAVEGTPSLVSTGMIRLAAQLHYLHKRPRSLTDSAVLREISRKFNITQMTARYMVLSKAVLQEDYLKRQEPMYRYPGRPSTEFRPENFPMERDAPVIGTIEPMFFTLAELEEENDTETGGQGSDEQ